MKAFFSRALVLLWGLLEGIIPAFFSFILNISVFSNMEKKYRMWLFMVIAVVFYFIFKYLFRRFDEKLLK